MHDAALADSGMGGMPSGRHLAEAALVHDGAAKQLA
jgi:hypothetical protein